MEEEINNFIIRTITSLILGSLLIWITYIGFLPFLILISFISVLALLEFYKLMEKIDLKCNKYLASIISIIISLLFFLSKGSFSFEKYEIFLPLILSIFILIILSDSIFFLKEKDLKNIFLKSIVTISGLFYTSWLLNHLILIREIPNFGFQYILCLFLSVWALDIFAYIFGMKLGKHKLSPRISPNKSIEGSIFGFIFAVLASYVLNTYIFKTNLGVKNSIWIGALIGIFGQIGDLFESLIKRVANEKDSGKIIPGHGGILDRFDSIIFTAPIFYYFIKFCVK